MNSVRSITKNSPQLKRLALWTLRCISVFGRVAGPAVIPAYWRFFRDWRQFRALGGDAKILDFYPCLFDRTPTTPINAQYFHQAQWAFLKILASGAREHVDIGSQIEFGAYLSASTRVTFVDIRPLELNLRNWHGVSGSILALPFSDRSITSLSSLHVIEHIGLGRYGDPIDPAGSAKAASEIQRVLSDGGRAYVSLPIGMSRVQFNGQRVFAINEVLEMFGGLRLRELSAVDSFGRFITTASPDEAQFTDIGSGADCGLGLFEFEQPASLE